MNFVRAETLIQEITADGKIRDIVTQVKRSEAEVAQEKKEDIIRNLPEFKREREAKQQDMGIVEDKKTGSSMGEEKDDGKGKGKGNNVHTIDEEEYEHYQAMEDKEREKKRQRLLEDSEALSMFSEEKNRLREDGVDQEKADLLSAMHRQNIEKAAQKAKDKPTAADRLKGRIVVKGKDSSSAPAPAAAAPKASGVGGLLGGYGSDSDDE
eukprot:TRINITY_DN9081_c0_g1_i1.p1 TRINITY_DN9081_c0_g1~~TRINITY_DN9081_c0_g1_i1.p1  ORF type:complete len:210 (-),score=64.48 TRINITY_DN9081_c0_g1_i1:97-726(-)